MTNEAGMSMKTKEHMTLCPKIKRHLYTTKRHFIQTQPYFAETSGLFGTFGGEERIPHNVAGQESGTSMQRGSFLPRNLTPKSYKSATGVTRVAVPSDGCIGPFGVIAFRGCESSARRQTGHAQTSAIFGPLRLGHKCVTIGRGLLHAGEFQGWQTR